MRVISVESMDMTMYNVPMTLAKYRHKCTMEEYTLDSLEYTSAIGLKTMTRQEPIAKELPVLSLLLSNIPLRLIANLDTLSVLGLGRVMVQLGTVRMLPKFNLLLNGSDRLLFLVVLEDCDDSLLAL